MNAKEIALSLCMFLLVVASISSIGTRPASAHISKVFGKIVIEVGWNIEPAITGTMNAAQVSITNGTGNNAKPVINGFSDLAATAKYGTIIKQLDFIPSQSAEGQYIASLIPTRPGTYSLVLKGTVDGQKIDTEIPLDDVTPSSTFEFPKTESQNGTAQDSILNSQLEKIINQLTNDIDASKRTATAASQIASDTQKSFQELKGVSDKSYLVGMVGIGLGLAGISMVALLIKRKQLV